MMHKKYFFPNLIVLLFFTSLFCKAQNSITIYDPLMLVADDNNPMTEEYDTYCICAGGAFDIGFSSTGDYGISNYYQLNQYCEGSPTNDEIQSLNIPDAVTYKEMATKLKYSGCSDWLKITATQAKEKTEAVWGPFKTFSCNLTLNFGKDVSVEFQDGINKKFQLPFEVGNKTAYETGNKFEVEIRDAATFEVVSYGDWFYAGIGSDEIDFDIPSLEYLQDNYGLDVGKYYMRLVATKPVDKLYSLSNWIRFEIAKINGFSTDLNIDVNTSEICLNGIACFTIHDAQTDTAYRYDWYINDNYHAGHYGSDSIQCWTFSGTGVKDVLVLVQEIYQGFPVRMFNTIITVNNVLGSLNIKNTMCTIDTVICTFQFGEDLPSDVNFIWSTNDEKASIIQSQFNKARVAVKEGVEKFNIWAEAQSESCHAVFSKEVNVVDIDAVLSYSSDSEICLGDSLQLFFQSNINSFQWLEGEKVLATNQETILVKPEKTTTYSVAFDDVCDDILIQITVKYCDTTTNIFSPTQKTLKNKIYFNPNPTKNQTTLYYKIQDNKNETILLKVYDLMGRNVYQQNLSPHKEHIAINTSDFENGMYLYVLEHTKEAVVLGSGKLLKQGN